MKTKLVVCFSLTLVSLGLIAAESVKVSQFGFDAIDSTRFVQAALDSGAKKVIFDRQSGPWVTTPVFARSNTEIVFEEDVELLAKRGEFRAKRDACLLNMVCVTNVTLRGLGKGGRLRMWIKDYRSKDYEKSEWRHALNILSSAKITVEKMSFLESGGDGIYLGEAKKRHTNTDITIRDCVCDANNRQGISVITVDGFLAERTVLSNTYGTNPKAGIDFEPNCYYQVLKRIVMRECVSQGNHGKGFEFYLAQLNGKTEPIDALFENCRSTGNHGAGFALAMGKIENGRALPGGVVIVRNCSFEDSPNSGILLSNKTKDGPRAIFENCKIVNCPNESDSKNRPVRMSVRTFWNPPVDGVEFRNLEIIQNDGREWLTKSAYQFLTGVSDISGEVHVTSTGGKRTVRLDERWRTENFMVMDASADIRLTPFDPNHNWEIVDSNPGDKAEFEKLCIRFKASAIVYADSKKEIRIEGRMHRFGMKNKKYPLLTVRNMKGRKIATVKPFGDTPCMRSFKVPAKGFYRIEWDMGRQGVTFSSCNVPFAIESGRDGVDLYRSNASVFFPHRANSVDTVICGGGGSERAGIKLVSPSGKIAAEWDSLGEWAFRRLEEEGLWRISFSRPSSGLYEDTFVTVVGDCPSLLFLSKDKYWK